MSRSREGGEEKEIQKEMKRRGENDLKGEVKGMFRIKNNNNLVHERHQASLPKKKVVSMT